MPLIEVETPRALHPAGLFTFTLAEISVVRMKSFDGTEDIDRLLWRFVSSQRTESGELYEVPVFTGKKYGNSKAKLTWLLDMLRPGLTSAEARSLDTDSFLGMKVEGSVKQAPSERDPDTKIASFVYLRPLGAPADPFVDGNAGAVPLCEWDDGCDKELTTAEVRSSQRRWPNGPKLCSAHGKEQIALDKIAAAETEDAFADAA